jgi:hypothetical protein
MSKKSKAAEHPNRLKVAEENEEALFCDGDGFDDCIIGVAERFGMPCVAAYDYEKLIEALIKQGMDREGAIEYFEFNIVGAWVGENTPVFVRLL